mgnify:CR=1 FL=1|tara:strand:- start:105 stop:881 length:777 start_codon:yes stop_codon:yes gene_type:complete
MKGFLGAFLVFSLWAVGSIYYLHLKGDTPSNINPLLLENASNTAIPKEAKDVELSQNNNKNKSKADLTDAVGDKNQALDIVDESRNALYEGSESSSKAVPANAIENAQLLADEIKKTIAISDTIDIDTNEPEQTLDTKIRIADGPSVSTRIFYPQYNNTDLVLDKEIVAYASELKQLLKDNPDKKVTIIGHTDNIGNGQDNFKIALRKSRQVKWYLTARRGIPRSKVTATSRGEEEPIESNKSNWGRAKNNRIEIIID